MKHQTKHLLALILVLPLLFACGKKTMPVAPQEVIPVPINDLGYQLDEKGLTLTWTYPAKAITGGKLERIDSFEVLRAVIPKDQYCADCPVLFSAPVNIVGGRLPVSRRHKAASYTETLLRPHHYYIYKVRARAGWHLNSADSNIVSFLWETPLAPPEMHAVQPGDNTLTLSWQPVRAHLDGTPFAGGDLLYRIYRSTEIDKNYLPLADSVRDQEFKDKAVQNGRSYYYRVQAFREDNNAKIAGMMSATALGIPRDLTAPLPPPMVNVVKTATGLTVVWEAVTAEDLGGYRVYRRLAADQQPKQIGATGPHELKFDDNSRPGQDETRYYSVTAIDSALPPNESPGSREAVDQQIK